MHEIVSNGILVISFLLFLILIGLIAFGRWVDSYLFMPLKDHVWRSRLPHDELMIDDRISAWHFHNYEKAPTVLFCHGNSGNISHRDYVVELMNDQHINLLIFDYSGYGKSSGTPSRRQLLEDGEEAYCYLRSKVDSEDIIVWGESIGGFVAVHVAGKYKCRNLVLLSAFSSLTEVLEDHGYSNYVPLVRATVGSFDNKREISKVECPVAIMHSRDDRLIPFSNAERLIESNKNAKLLEIRGGHSSPEISVPILSDLMDFCGISRKRVSRSEPILNKLKNLKGYHFAT